MFRPRVTTDAPRGRARQRRRSRSRGPIGGARVARRARGNDTRGGVRGDRERHPRVLGAAVGIYARGCGSVAPKKCRAPERPAACEKICIAQNADEDIAQLSTRFPRPRHLLPGSSGASILLIFSTVSMRHNNGRACFRCSFSRSCSSRRCSVAGVLHALVRRPLVLRGGARRAPRASSAALGLVVEREPLSAAASRRRFRRRARARRAATAHRSRL